LIQREPPRRFPRPGSGGAFFSVPEAPALTAFRGGSYDSIAMTRYMKRHERDLLKTMAANPDKKALGELLAFHDKQIGWLQHERLAHLITMMFVDLFFVLALAFTRARFSWPALALTSLLLILAIAYVFHYYRLENTVQRWYSISNRIRANLRENE